MSKTVAVVCFDKHCSRVDCTAIAIETFFEEMFIIPVEHHSPNQAQLFPLTLPADGTMYGWMLEV
jgi:hypothetical protein